YDLSIQMFDTVNVYSNSEFDAVYEKVIKWLNFPREVIVVMAEVCCLWSMTLKELYHEGGVDPGAVGYANRRGLSGEHLLISIRLGMELLQLDYINVLKCIVLFHVYHP
ncbi:hypothetical protein BC834DRAFT_833463, partial [Gloeopeniophorella convolvens]